MPSAFPGIGARRAPRASRANDVVNPLGRAHNSSRIPLQRPEKVVAHFSYLLSWKTRPCVGASVADALCNANKSFSSL